MPPKSLDLLLKSFEGDANAEGFILADAKDADMAFGLRSCGEHWPPCDEKPRYRTLRDYEQQIRDIVKQGLVDIVLMSASTTDRLARAEALFADTPVTPAVRMNDTSDIWLAGSEYSYAQEPSLAFATTSVSHASRGSIDPSSAEVAVDLGLYSVTLNHDSVLDREALETYRRFRHQAESLQFRHFLEVFPPNAPRGVNDAAIPEFVADSIVRMLAGVVAAERPVFLKIPYLGKRLTTQLCEFDDRMVVGIMGGASGTTHDAFQLLAQAKQCGVRAALFGRKINNAEDQLLFIQHLRWVADGALEASEAVRSYHAELQKRGIPSRRSVEDDSELTSASAGLDCYG